MALPGVFGEAYGGYDELFKFIVEFIPAKKKRFNEPGAVKGASGKKA